MSTNIFLIYRSQRIMTGDDLHPSILGKTTDRNTVLHADNFHPAGHIKNNPYGQTQRQRRICDSN